MYLISKQNQRSFEVFVKILFIPECKVAQYPFNTKYLIRMYNNSKKNKNQENFTNFLLTSAIYEHPPPPDQQPSAFRDPLPPQKVWRNVWI